MTSLIKTMSHRVKNFFDPTAEKIARETQFVRRTSKLTGSRFLITIVFGLVEHATASLNDLTEFCEEHCGISISAQAFDERINALSLSFMKHMFTLALQVFQQTVRLPVPLLTQFSAVNITDSTGISLPESLRDEFPGSGGNASESAVKLQVVLEFLTGRFQTITLTDGTTPDQTYRRHLELAEANSLNLFDLGYFTLSHVAELVKRKSFFVCRWLYGTNLYTEDGHKLDLLTFLRGDDRNHFEVLLRLGAKLQIPCRVCFFRAPEEVAHRRRQQAYKKAVKHGRRPTKEALELQGWTILLTNVPAARLSLEQVALLYAVRWQVELLFKLWKSHMHLHRISGVRKARVLVELYAKLIGLVLFQFLAMPLRAKDIDLSPIKAFKRFRKQSGAFAEALQGMSPLQKAIERLHQRMLKYAKREKRKKRLSTCQQVLLEVDYYA